MSKHTPGPWVADGTEVFSTVDCNDHPILGDGYDNLTCRSVDEMKANARLIAAAPELLEALKAIDSMYARAWDNVDGSLHFSAPSVRKFERIHADARAAIAKATGEAK